MIPPQNGRELSKYTVIKINHRILYTFGMFKKAFILIVLVLFVGIGYYIYSQQNHTSTSQPQSEISPSVIEEIIPEGTSMNDIMAGGNSYEDPMGIYSFSYPTNYMLDMQNNNSVVRVYKQGPTQQGQTELYDGVIITFEKIDLQGQSLRSWLDKELETMTADQTTQVTQPKKQRIINGYPGYTYLARGLGEFSFIVVQKDASSPNAIRISSLVADPTNAGFQEQTDQIISSVLLN